MIESKNYAALGDRLATLPETPYTEALRRLPRLFGQEEVFAEAEVFCKDNPQLRETLSYMKKLYRALSMLGLGDRLMVDLGLVQRNDYYTGVVFSAYVENCGEAVLMGGRYDTLLEKFGEPMPAVGFAADVDALAAKLFETEAQAVETPEVLVHAGDGEEIRAQLLLKELTEKGKIVESSVFETEEEAREYAEKRGIPEVIIL